MVYEYRYIKKANVDAGVKNTFDTAVKLSTSLEMELSIIVKTYDTELTSTEKAALDTEMAKNNYIFSVYGNTIFVSTDGSFWKLTVDNAGVLTTTKVV